MASSLSSLHDLKIRYVLRSPIETAVRFGRNAPVTDLEQTFHRRVAQIVAHALAANERGIADDHVRDRSVLRLRPFAAIQQRVTFLDLL